MNTQGSIDLVVTWLDSHDPQWLNAREQYAKSGSFNACYYREWDLFRYWFRGVEKNLPWIRKVHLVTFGHVPEWLELKHPKLQIVKHTDFIPEMFLPTFSDIPIEVFFHQIPNLADQFICSDDDTYFMSPMKPEDFFRDGLPCDCPEVCPVTEEYSDSFAYIIFNTLSAINRNFNLKASVMANQDKWFSPEYPERVHVRNRAALLWEKLPGFRNPHMPLPYLKRTFQKVWEKEYALLYRTASSRFRKVTDIVWLFRYWQLMAGDFTPHYEDAVRYVRVSASEEVLSEVVSSGKYKMICVNDSSEPFDFDSRYELLHRAFERVFPESSSFEVSGGSEA